MTTVLIAAWRLASIIVPIPLALLVAAGLWITFDKASAVRRAVDKAVTDLVAGAQIKAIEATLDAERRLRMYAEGKAAAAQAANDAFQQKLVFSEMEKEGLADELAELQSRPAPDGCVVTPDLLDRLR